MTERTLRDRIAALLVHPTRDQDDMIYNLAIGDALAALDAHTAAQPASELCDVCGGHGMAGHPDSGYLCCRCHGSGGIKPAPDAVADAAWSGVENAPYDTPLTVLAGGMTFAAILRRDASLNEDGESCDQWQAVVEGEHPPCWTDGACWESNEDGIPCLWPEAFMPLTKPADFLTATKGHQP